MEHTTPAPARPSETASALTAPAVESGPNTAASKRENRAVFVDPRGRRRRWMQASGVTAALFGAGFVGALFVALHAAPAQPVAHVPGTAASTPNVTVVPARDGTVLGERR